MIKELVRTISDYPKAGIEFRDITTVLKDPVGFKEVVDQFYNLYKDQNIDIVVGIESRGFPIGGALAYKLSCGFVLARKQGKLPAKVVSREYQLEYGTDCIEIHEDAIKSGINCLIIDDLIATGGTAEATCKLVSSLGGNVVSCGFIINLPDLNGMAKLKDFNPKFLIEFKGH